jgi:hypothetical protein
MQINLDASLSLSAGYLRVMHLEPEMKFNLKLLDSAAQEFCEGIVCEMVSLFSITEEEAISRINTQWSHLESLGGDEELIYHEDEKFWAQDIYYGPDSFWWLSDKVRSEKNLPKLVPRKLQNA